MSNYKKFSKELYDENDKLAKDVACDFLISRGFILETPLSEQKEIYKKGDFYIKLNKSIILVEVERKKVWKKSGEWEGWNTIDIPYRKKDSKSNIFIMVNNNCDTIAMIKTEKILESKVQTKDTKYTTDEKFFNVNLDNFYFYYKVNNKWKRIRK